MSLQRTALMEILNRGSPILGTPEECWKDGKLSDWMARLPDETKLVHMNLPGTHDTCTWNYTPELQKSLERHTGPIPDSRVYRCQQRSIFQMLNEGIRVFDLRYAWNPDKETIGFYHSKALLSPTTRMEDVFFGLYTWLDNHPTETVLVSMNYEPGTGTSDDARLQETLYNILTSDLAKKYWKQARGTLGTLGEARGKLILLQRFDFNLIAAHLTERTGIHLDPGHWTVNGKSIELTYNAEEGQVAYIQDYYREKFQAITAHLEHAMDSNLHPDQLYISFSSASFRVEDPALALTPEVYALGNAKESLIGLNHRLASWLQEKQGNNRLGVVLMDFYDDGLVKLIIGENITSKI